jgi:hypothetical protein
MKRAALLLGILALASCEEAPDFDSAWNDPATGARFILGEPCERHYEMWLEISAAAVTLWGDPNCRIYVWMAHSPETMIYCQGEWQPWPAGRPAMTWRLPGQWAHIYVMATGPDPVTRELMSHECVHVFCGIEGHPEVFYELKAELTDYINTQ